MSNKGKEFLQEYSWPGNFRELEDYVSVRYMNTFNKGNSLITLEDIMNAPFGNNNFIEEADYESLIEIMKKFLMDWEYSKGSFLDEIISPILAKLYQDDCFKHLSKTDKWEQASKILGIGGGRYKGSLLSKAYAKFPEVKNKLGF
jgi:DNA-binding NtrC family response regulator